MPNYSFLLHSPQNIPPFTGWQTIPAITANDISDIPDGLVNMTSAKVGTSIPTPLARIFSFQSAFQFITKQLQNGRSENDIKQTIYAGLVSDCLDFLEWMFVDGVESFTTAVINLSHDNNLGETRNLNALSAAFNNTIKSYFPNGRNTGQLQITLFLYRGEVVGGTSPYSLLFTSPNWRRKKSTLQLDEKRGLTTDILFDNEFSLLGSRDPRFVKYLFDTISHIEGDNTHPLRAFADYINTSIATNSIVLPQISTQNGINFNPVDNVSFTLSRINITQQDLIASDFYLDKTLSKIKDNKKPLVLSKSATLQGNYIRGVEWGKDILRGVNDATLLDDLNERNLPNAPQITEKYPFITDEDLFQKKLIDISYNVNDDYFYVINSNTYGTRFLLPIKPLYFEIIGISNVEDFNNHISIEERDNKLTIRLIVPIKGTDSRFSRRNISFVKIYNLDPNSFENDIIQLPIEFAFFPFFRRITDTAEELNNHRKTILWFEKTNNENKIENIVYYDNSFNIIGNDKVYNSFNKKSIDTSNVDCPDSMPLTPHKRMHYDEDTIGYKTNYFSTDKDFRLIEVTAGGISAILIPKFIEKKANLNRQFKYAIDFGTTNTHVEFALMEHGELVHQGENEPAPFKINISNTVPTRKNGLDEKPLVVLLHKYHDNLGDVDKVYPILMREFMPSSVGSSDSPYSIKFPTRTVMLDFQEPNSDEQTAFLHSNIAFKIGEKDDFHPNAIYTPELKWLLEKSDDHKKDAYKHRIRIFFEQLFYMIKYKAIMDDCDPDNNLILVFTSPISMNETLRNDIRTQIKKSIRRVFNTNPDDTNRFVFDLEESLAPYENNKNKFTSDRFCNIDIGGGTTDLLLGYKINNTDYNYFIASFKFAGNHLWGNDVNPTLHNGIIQYFLDYAEKKSFSLPNDHPFKITYNEFFKYLKKGANDSELVSVLFKNDNILEFRKTVFENRKDFKLLLVIHYAAIVYYINQIVKTQTHEKLKNNSDNPLTLSLSGNGSLYLKLIRPKGLAKILSKKFSEVSFDVINDLIEFENPKEITARGALKMRRKEAAQNNDDDDYEAQNTDPIKKINLHLVTDITSFGMVNELSQTLDDFFKPLLDILQTNEKLKEEVGDISNYLGLFSKQNYTVVINKWLNERPILNNETDSVFFNPIRYLLFDLSRAIYEKYKSN